VYVFSDRTLMAMDQSKQKKKPYLIANWENGKGTVYEHIESLGSQMTTSLSLTSSLHAASLSPSPENSLTVGRSSSMRRPTILGTLSLPLVYEACLTLRCASRW